MTYRKSFLLVVTSVAMLLIVFAYFSACCQLIKTIIECRVTEGYVQ